MLSRGSPLSICSSVTTGTVITYVVLLRALQTWSEELKMEICEIECCCFKICIRSHVLYKYDQSKTLPSLYLKVKICDEANVYCSVLGVLLVVAVLCS